MKCYISNFGKKLNETAKKIRIKWKLNAKGSKSGDTGGNIQKFSVANF